MSTFADYTPTKEFLKLLDGKVKRTRLWEMVRSGDIDAIQPTGPRGHLFVRRSEAERLLRSLEAKK